MGINEINAYFNNNDSFSYIHRALTVIPNKKKTSFLGKMALYGMDIAMIVAPLLTYLFQINKFYKTKSSKGFSKFICLLLFLGNIFRVFFWTGTHFKNTLLYQSIGIITFQVILIHLCIKFQDNEIQKTFLPADNKQEQKIPSGKSLLFYLIHWKQTLHPKTFWKWTIEIEYYKFMFFVGFVLFVLCQIFKNYKIFFHLIGIMSASFESFTCVPQVIENYKVKNSKNVSFSMIFCWFLGDSFRLYYNINYKSPLQIILGILVQVILDIVVCIQICIYRDKKNITIVNVNANKKENINEINKLMKKIDENDVKKKESKDAVEIELKKSSSSDEGERNEQKLEQTNTSDNS